MKATLCLWNSLLMILKQALLLESTILLLIQNHI